MSHTTSPRSPRARSSGNDRFEPLEAYAWDAYSQMGEDGVLHEILRRIGVLDARRAKWCVEFGAWDGVHLSNTCNLIENHGFRAVMIEAGRKRFRQLCRNWPGEEVIKINRFVTLDGADRLDAILGETALPADFDLLSIDIDGCDYHVWESLQDYRPKLVIVEYNSTLPVDIPYVQPPDFSIRRGNGVKALDNLARHKGYTTVCLNGPNLIAVRDDLLERVSDVPPPAIEDMADPEQRRFVFVGYDGRVLSNFDELPVNWHPTRIFMDDLQVLPAFLRKHGDDYSPLHWAAFGLLDYWRRFKRMLRRS